MRPVNLIPSDERRGTRRPLRTGPFSYLLVGILVAVLASITAVVVTQNQISDRKAEIAQLEQREQEASARAESLRAFADFATTEQARTETVSSLAQSRFDWERVLREMAVVIPADVTLHSLTGTADPSVTLDGATSDPLRDGIPGPALSLAGCAASQEGVAELVAALEDIDGVTRVGLSNTQREDQGSVGEATGGDTRPCPGGTHFVIVTAFDAAPVASSSAPGAVPPAAPPAADPGVDAAAQQQAQAAESIQQGAQQAEQAVTSTQGG